MNKNVTTWIVIADSHDARIFSKVKKENLALIHQLAADLDFEHKKPGRTFNSVGTLRHGIEPRTEPRDVEKQHFVQKIILILDQAFKNNQFENLILIAPPKILGILNNSLDEHLAKKVVAKLDKNITDMKIHELEPYLKSALQQAK